MGDAFATDVATAVDFQGGIEGAHNQQLTVKSIGALFRVCIRHFIFPGSPLSYTAFASS